MSFTLGGKKKSQPISDYEVETCYIFTELTSHTITCMSFIKTKEFASLQNLGAHVTNIFDLCDII